MKQKTLTATLVLAAFVSFPVAATGKKSEAPGPAPAAEAAMKAHIDPVTGEFVQKPGLSPKTAAEASPVTSLPMPRVELIDSKRGTKRVILDRRFDSQLVDTVGPERKVSLTSAEQPATAGQPPAPETVRRHDRQ